MYAVLELPTCQVLLALIQVLLRALGQAERRVVEELAALFLLHAAVILVLRLGVGIPGEALPVAPHILLDRVRPLDLTVQILVPAVAYPLDGAFLAQFLEDPLLLEVDLLLLGEVVLLLQFVRVSCEFVDVLPFGAAVDGDAG